jgi:hypothetical protein
VYEPPSLGGAQIDDMNPGIGADGLFWTIPIPDEAIEVHLGKGFASMEADVSIVDYGTFANALFGGGPGIPGPGTPADVSFTVEWSGVNERVKIRNTDSPLAGGGFAGEFIRNAARMEWEATVGDFEFVSDPLATSSSSFAEIGQERNGVFFR